jgi:hypothetical protein
MISENKYPISVHRHKLESCDTFLEITLNLIFFRIKKEEIQERNGLYKPAKIRYRSWWCFENLAT